MGPVIMSVIRQDQARVMAGVHAQQPDFGNAWGSALPSLGTWTIFARSLPENDRDCHGCAGVSALKRLIRAIRFTAIAISVDFLVIQV